MEHISLVRNERKFTIPSRVSSFLEILENGVPFVIENLRKCAPSNRDLWENLEGKPALVTTVIPTHVL